MPSRTGEIRIAHSSDLHVDDGYTMRAWNGDGNGPLEAVIDAAHSAGAHVLLLTGDVFEHNRLKDDILSRTRQLLSEAPLPVVMLPGNHDPLTEESVWRRGEIMALPGIHVLGDDGSETATFTEFDLDIWGRAHVDYDDMAPLSGSPDRRAIHHIAAAHGHYVEKRPEGSAPSASWLITADEIEETDADYVALGHWNVFTKVGCGEVPARYSGAPDYANTINIVRLSEKGDTEIERFPVRGPGVI